MNRVPADDETQRDLERRALLNASWLARKLGYQDSLDRRSERILVAAIGAGLVLLVTAIVVSGMANSKKEESELARHRCEVAVYVEVLPEMERLVWQMPGDRFPTLESRAEAARRNASRVATTRCAAELARR